MSLKWNMRASDKSFGFNLDKFNSKEKIFHAIYFIDNITGSLLVSNNFSVGSCISETNEDLISSFLNAINLFIKEIKKDDNEEIQEINFKGTRILYEKKGRLTCIGISNKTNLKLERKIIREFIEDFYFKFELIINRFNGKIDPSILDYKNRLRNLDLNDFYKLDNQA
ncbi:MAG: hypothetical protein ACTSUT_14050 [Promethearchaeota archaeon]